MSTLLIKNIRTLVSCDSADTVYENVDLYAENGFIKEIGVKLDRKADKTIDASHMLCYPGLVNTHHHLYQVHSMADRCNCTDRTVHLAVGSSI